MWRLALWCAALWSVGLLRAARAGLADLLPPPLAASLADLVNAAAATCEILPLDLLFSRHYTAEMPHLDLVEYTRTSKRQFRAMSAASRLSPDGGPLVVYVPGWWNTPGDDSSQALVKALLRTHERVLVLDTRLAFCRGYVSSASRVKAMAHLLYAFIKKLSERGFGPESLHLIGFSLGAHVAGLAGRLARRGLGRPPARLTALDPARPCFAAGSALRVRRRDARFVQVLHSSWGALGVAEPLGHADVYVPRQAECDARAFSLACDHAQAWRLYARSLAGPAAFLGHRCSSWEEVQSGQCSGNATVLGYWCDERTRGLFLHHSPEQEVQERKSELQSNDPFSFFSFLGR